MRTFQFRGKNGQIWPKWSNSSHRLFDCFGTFWLFSPQIPKLSLEKHNNTHIWGLSHFGARMVKFGQNGQIHYSLLRSPNAMSLWISGGKGTSISFLSHLIWSGSLSDIPSILDENTTLHICMGFDVNFTRHFHTSPLSNWLPFGSDMGGTWEILYGWWRVVEGGGWMMRFWPDTKMRNYYFFFTEKIIG